MEPAPQAEKAAAHHATRVEFGELLERSDILSVHVPLTTAAAA